MRETERRIRLYQARLPRIRQKIMAALLIFAVSAATLAVSTFSWVTLSIAPETTGISTTVAANGNLEIALAETISLVPGESEIGDSLLELAARNITWGNLINLSDASYGLENIVFRPASLNNGNLLTNPLYSIIYSADGRAQENFNSAYAYTQYNGSVFEEAEGLGVRAISSVKFTEFEVETDDTEIIEYLMMLSDLNDTNSADSLFLQASGEFAQLSKKLETVSGLISTYANGTLRNAVNNEVCENDDIVAFYNLMVELDNTAMTTAGRALMRIFETYQLQTSHKSDYTYTAFASVDEFCSGVKAELTKMNSARTANGLAAVSFVSLDQYLADRIVLKNNIAEIQPYYQQIQDGIAVVITWENVHSTVNSLVDIPSAKLRGKTISQWFGSLSQNLTDLLSILNGKASENPVVIYGGLVERLDKFLHTGTGLYVESITIYVDSNALKDRAGSLASLLGSNPSIKANITTDAVSVMPTSTSQAERTLASTSIGIPATSRGYIAQETYGLALDFWVRTNGVGSYLVLEGAPIMDEEDVFQTVVWTTSTEENGTTTSTEYKQESTQIYVVNIETTTTYADTTKDALENLREGVELYKREGDSNWYYLDNHTVADLTTTTTEVKDDNDNLISTTVVTYSTPKPKKIDVVVGYSGVNRIWNHGDKDSTFVTEYSTSQGSGSCYTFYANSPEEMSQILTLLSAMKLAFINGSTGELLATASLATDLYYADVGKVIVPIMLDDDVRTNVGIQDSETGNDVLTITELERNEPILVSTIIYLDGTLVSNDMVLSSADIQGSLNIQFGAYVSPDALSNEALQNAERRITASVDKTDFAAEAEAGATEFTVNVTLTVDGKAPEKISANFIRKINSTQGKRQESFDFTASESEPGVWTGSDTFDAPGEYVLRSLTVDGVDYSLPSDNPISVKIPGMQITSVSGLKGANYTYMTSEGSETEEFTIVVKKGPGDTLPTDVKGVFTNENNVNIVTTYSSEDNESWKANVTFGTSGVYTMKYVILDGEYYEIPEIVRNVYVGLKTRVYIQTDITQFDMEKEKFEYVTGGMQYLFYGTSREFSVSAVVLDNTGNEMQNLRGVVINYGGVDSNLEWNAATRRYDGGEFLIASAGTFSFESLSVATSGGTETITVAVSAPTITAVPTEPMAYEGTTFSTNDNYILALNSTDATKSITLKFKNASASSVFGKFSKEVDGITTYYILKAQPDKTSTDKITDYIFTLPRGDGNWTLEAVKMDNVYDGTNFYLIGDEDGEKDSNGEKIIIIPDDGTGEGYTESAVKVAFDDIKGYYAVSDGVWAASTKVVATVKTETVTYIGKDANDTTPNNLTNAFMEQVNLPGMSIVIKDFEGQAIPGVSNVTISVMHQYNTMAYTTDNTTVQGGNATGQKLTLTPTDNNDGTYTLAAGAQKIWFDGTYLVQASYSIGTITRTISASAIHLKSTLPMVTISAISPSGSQNAYNGCTRSGRVNQYCSIINVSYTAGIQGSGTVANVCYVGSITTINVLITKYQYVQLTQPTVTIKLSNIGEADTVTLSFGESAKIYDKEEGTNIAQYNWTANGDCKRYIGSYSDAGASDDTRTVAGTITANTLTAVYGGVTYSIPITTITINNPY